MRNGLDGLWQSPPSFRGRGITVRHRSDVRHSILIMRFNSLVEDPNRDFQASEGSPPCLVRRSESICVSEMISGSHSIPLSVPIPTSTPLSISLLTGVFFPKYALDVGHTTTGTSASAHFDMSSSVASHMWTRNVGSSESMKLISSLTRSLAWMANALPAERASSATDSM